MTKEGSLKSPEEADRHGEEFLELFLLDGDLIKECLTFLQTDFRIDMDK